MTKLVQLVRVMAQMELSNLQDCSQCISHHLYKSGEAGPVDGILKTEILTANVIDIQELLKVSL